MIDISRKLNLLAVGDILQDAWHIGEFTKFSPEGGQPVFVESQCVTVPGGAGNTVRQFEHWNADVRLFGCNAGIKHRYVAGGNYFLRVDDDKRPANFEQWRTMDDLIDSIRPGVDGVIISDYDKGSVLPIDAKAIIQTCLEHCVPCFVDPKQPPEVFAGATVLKCNQKYADSHVFKRLDGFELIVVTRGESRPTVVKPGYVGLSPGRIKQTVNVASVVGAGDAYLASLVSAMLRGMPFVESVDFAHSAGRCYVQHPFNRPVHPLEVARDLDPVLGKITDLPTLAGYLRVRCFKPIVIPGCFDGNLHAGHRHTAIYAASLKGHADCAIALVNDDHSVRRLKGQSRPLEPLQRRLEALASIHGIDFVIQFDGNTSGAMADLSQCGVCVKGHDSIGKVTNIPDSWTLEFAPTSGCDVHTSDLVH